jgi:hypothetical protein
MASPDSNPCVCRMLTAERGTLATEAEELKATKKMLQAEVSQGTTRVEQAERKLLEALAALDRKRQKKRDYKAVANKFKRLWQSVRCYCLAAVFLAPRTMRGCTLHGA